MTQKAGIQMIEMWCKMVEAEFDPVIAQMSAAERKLREQTEIDVKKKLGIYDKLMELEVCKLRVSELEQQLSSWTDKTYYGADRRSELRKAVDAEMEKRRNGSIKAVYQLKADTIKTIKLSTATENVAEIFKDLGSQLTKLIAQLPAPKELKRIK